MKTILILVLSTFLMGCGMFEQIYDDSNYESLSNEKGTIKLFSGGQLIKEYKNATVIYSSANSEAVLFRNSDGKRVYWQGHMIMEL